MHTDLTRTQKLHTILGAEKHSISCNVKAAPEKENVSKFDMLQSSFKVREEHQSMHVNA
jgi:hypothetical protein